MEIILAKEKETPGTWRFKENKEDHPMTIYLTKEQSLYPTLWPHTELELISPEHS
jgi:hypothetical protein